MGSVGLQCPSLQREVFVIKYYRKKILPIKDWLEKTWQNAKITSYIYDCGEAKKPNCTYKKLENVCQYLLLLICCILMYKPVSNYFDVYCSPILSWAESIQHRVAGGCRATWSKGVHFPFPFPHPSLLGYLDMSQKFCWHRSRQPSVMLCWLAVRLWYGLGHMGWSQAPPSLCLLTGPPSSHLKMHPFWLL